MSTVCPQWARPVAVCRVVRNPNFPRLLHNELHVSGMRLPMWVGLCSCVYSSIRFAKINVRHTGWAKSNPYMAAELEMSGWTSFARILFISVYNIFGFTPLLLFSSVFSIFCWGWRCSSQLYFYQARAAWSVWAMCPQTLQHNNSLGHPSGSGSRFGRSNSVGNMLTSISI